MTNGKKIVLFILVIVPLLYIYSHIDRGLGHFKTILTLIYY